MTSKCYNLSHFHQEKVLKWRTYRVRQVEMAHGAKTARNMYHIFESPNPIQKFKKKMTLYICSNF